jgi:chromosome segregation ATPase
MKHENKLIVGFITFLVVLSSTSVVLAQELSAERIYNDIAVQYGALFALAVLVAVFVVWIIGRAFDRRSKSDLTAVESDADLQKRFGDMLEKAMQESKETTRQLIEAKTESIDELKASNSELKKNEKTLTEKVNALETEIRELQKQLALKDKQTEALLAVKDAEITRLNKELFTAQGQAKKLDELRLEHASTLAELKVTKANYDEDKRQWNIDRLEIIKSVASKRDDTIPLPDVTDSIKDIPEDTDVNRTDNDKKEDIA